MNDEQLLTTKHKAFVGAIGGLCLVLLKLIEQKFYVGSASTNIVVAAYLTYAAYIVLGMIVAAYLTDHDLPNMKCKRHALMMGLLAPSILIAIVSKPVDYQNIKGSVLKDLPSIGAIFINEAYAQEPTQPGKDESNEILQMVVKLTKADVDISFGQAFLTTINRAPIDKKFVYVVGVSNEQARAVDVANRLNSIVECKNSDTSMPCAIVFSPVGSNKNFVSVGGLVSEDSAYEAKLGSWQAVLKKLRETNDKSTTDIANLVAQGEVVQGYALFDQ